MTGPRRGDGFVLVGEASDRHPVVVVVGGDMGLQATEKAREWHQPAWEVGGSSTWIDPVSDVMRSLLNQADGAARLPIPVILFGETGTGKEVVARRIHAASARAARPFIAVDVAAIDEALFTASMFGHERGAFTGAVSDRIGWFEAADGATLFLDEIGDLSPVCQRKLLRALQDNEFSRVGSSSTRRVDIRILAATHRDLRAMVADGSFREDLYYRLNVLPIRVPALRDRKDDLPLLVESFSRQASQRFGVPLREWSDEAFAVLLAHNWPGNVRELKQVVERTVAMSSSPILRAEAVLLDSIAPIETDLRSILRACERSTILGALHATQGNVSRAARLLSLPLATLQDKCRRLGLR
jgi:DNA-binding NtrC family response regulator